MSTIPWPYASGMNFNAHLSMCPTLIAANDFPMNLLLVFKVTSAPPGFLLISYEKCPKTSFECDKNGADQVFVLNTLCLCCWLLLKWNTRSAACVLREKVSQRYFRALTYLNVSIEAHKNHSSPDVRFKTINKSRKR